MHYAKKIVEDFQKVTESIDFEGVFDIMLSNNIRRGFYETSA